MSLIVKWKDKDLSTWSELFEAAIACEDKDEAKQFMETLVMEGMDKEIALKNLGYMAGYYTQKELDIIVELFGAEHPYFGKTMPGPKEAFEIGVRMATEWEEKKQKEGK